MRLDRRGMIKKERVELTISEKESFRGNKGGYVVED